MKYRTFQEWAYAEEDGKRRCDQFPDGSLKWIAAAWELGKITAYKHALHHTDCLLDSLPYGPQYDLAHRMLKKFKREVGEDI